METGLIGPVAGMGGLLIAIGGIIGGYFTYKAKIDFLIGLVKELRSDHESEVKRAGEVEAKAFALELRIEREFVKKDDLIAVERRLGERLNTIEHTVKNTTTQILAVLSNMPGARTTRRASE